MPIRVISVGVSVKIDPNCKVLKAVIPKVMTHLRVLVNLGLEEPKTFRVGTVRSITKG